MTSFKISKLLIISGTILIVLILIVWQIIWVISWQKTDYIFDGIKINDIKVSGLNLGNAEIMLNERSSELLENKTIAIVYEDISQTIQVKPFSSYDFKKDVQNAYDIGRSSNIISNYFSMIKARILGNKFETKPKFDILKLQNMLERISDIYYIAPQNAQLISFDPAQTMGNRLTIIHEISGREIDIEKTTNSIISAISSNQSTSLVYLKEVKADIGDEIIKSIDTVPITSELTIKDITLEHENAILQIVGAGRHKIIAPGEEISIIEFSGGEEYIYFIMPDEGTKSDYEKALCQKIPTQIFNSAILAEIDVTQRHSGAIDQPAVLTGTATIINKYYDMKLKNNLDFPVIIRIGYKRQGVTSQIFCEIYRPQMQYGTLLRSIIKDDGQNRKVDIIRVYVDEKGNPIDSVLIETINIEKSNDR